MPKDSNKILLDYRTAALEHGKATIEGNSRVANKQYAKLAKIYQEFESDHSLANNVLGDLLSDENPPVSIWAASHALKLNIRINEAENVLKRASMDRTIGIFRMDAEMTLRNWEKKRHTKSNNEFN